MLPERRYRISACLRTAEILAFRPLRGTPSSRHVPLYDRNAFHRDCKVGVVISSDSCWGGSNSFGRASKRGRFGVLYSSAVPPKKNTVREKSTMGSSFMPLFVRTSLTLRDRGVFFEQHGEGVPLCDKSTSSAADQKETKKKERDRGTVRGPRQTGRCKETGL